MRLPEGWPFLVVAGLAGAAALAIFLPRLGTPFGGGCVPADFPAYPGLQVEEQYHDASAAADQCNVVWHVDADGSSVSDYYSRELQRGDWELVEGGNPLLFRRHSDPQTNGSLAISTGRPSMLVLYLRMNKR